MIGVVAAGVYRFNFTSDDIHVMQDGKMMKHDDAMIKKDDAKMTGAPEWTKEEMDAMEKDHMMMSGADMKKDDMMKHDDAKMMSGSDMMKDDMMKKESVMMKPTGYISYDAMKVDEALKSWQKVVLFFHASWCPSCRALDSAINADLSSIPADALIVKVDYDMSTEMKKKYGVTSQHTTVLIDKDMALVSKKLGARSVAAIFE